MRCLLRNKTSFYFSSFKEKTEIQDEYGNATGQYEVSYENPTKAYANISAAVGEAETQQFGEHLVYDKVISIEKGTPIDEYSVLWVDVTPVLEQDGSTQTPYDYVVKKVAESLNGVSIAISKVNVRA